MSEACSYCTSPECTGNGGNGFVSGSKTCKEGEVDRLRAEVAQLKAERDAAMWLGAFRSTDGDDGECCGLSAAEALDVLFPDHADRLNEAWPAGNERVTAWVKARMDK